MKTTAETREAWKSTREIKEAWNSRRQLYHLAHQELHGFINGRAGAPLDLALDLRVKNIHALLFTLEAQDRALREWAEAEASLAPATQ